MFSPWVYPFRLSLGFSLWLNIKLLKLYTKRFIILTHYLYRQELCSYSIVAKSDMWNTKPRASNARGSDAVTHPLCCSVGARLVCSVKSVVNREDIFTKLKTYYKLYVFFYTGSCWIQKQLRITRLVIYPFSFLYAGYDNITAGGYFSVVTEIRSAVFINTV